MKRKKVVVLLSATMLLFAYENVAIRAENVSEVLNEFESEDYFSQELPEKEDTDLQPEGEIGQEETTDIQDEEFDSLDDNENEEFSSNLEMADEITTGETDNSILDNIVDDSNSLRNFSGVVDKSDIFLGENISNTLKVCKYDENGEMQFLDSSNYTILGYVTEVAYLNAEHTLDNLNNFNQIPDATGTWFLVFEGITPYYGRQTVRIVVHDEYDLSMYNWLIDSEVLVGENPENALRIFKNEYDDTIQLSQDEYEVCGYITEEKYADMESSLDDISDLLEKPDAPGQWGMVVEGKGFFHGKLLAWVTMNDEKDLGMYQCNISKENLELGENINDYIAVERNRNESSKIISADNYKVVGFIKEKEFAANGYDINCSVETMEKSANEVGGWYVVLEGTEPYFGRLISWFEVNKGEGEIEETVAADDMDKNVEEAVVPESNDIE